MKRSIYTIVIMISFLLLVGCSSQVLNIKEPQKNRPYKELGVVTGSTSGMMIFGFIPVRQNDRMTRAYEAAYQQAVEKYNADGLVDVKISERWYNFVVFLRFRLTVEGQAIKYIDNSNEVIEEETQDVYLFKMN
jgi:hypothetical protein